MANPIHGKTRKWIPPFQAANSRSRCCWRGPERLTASGTHRLQNGEPSWHTVLWDRTAWLASLDRWISRAVRPAKSLNMDHLATIPLAKSLAS